MRRLQERRAQLAPLSSRHSPVAGVAVRRLLILSVAATVATVDQLTKTWAVGHLAEGPRRLLPGLKLELTYNRGIAFGLGRGITPVLVAVVVTLIVVGLGLGRRASRTATPLGAVAMGLLLGGAAGNLIDRLVRHHGGAVVDFIDVRFWWVFNVGDASIVVGAILLALVSVTRGRPVPSP